MVLVPQVSVSRIGWVYIPEGFVALITNLGADVHCTKTDSKSWPPGFHAVKPWYKVSRLISTQNVVFDSPVKDCKTKDNVTCNINVLIVFGIEEKKAVDFVYQLGPEKLDDLLRAQQEESVRQMCGETLVENIYDLHGSNTENTLKDMNERFAEYGVKVMSFTITNVRIPEKIASTMQEKTLYTALAQEKNKEQNLAMLVMSNNQNQQKNKDMLTNEKEQMTVEAMTMQAEMSKQIAEVLAITENQLRDIEATQRATVAKIEAEGDLKVAEWDKTRASMLKEFSMSAKAEAMKIRNEAKLYDQQVRAETQIEVSKLDAEGKRLIADAQGKGKEGFKALRDYELEIEKLKILQNLCSNRKIKVHGSAEQIMGLVPENNLLNQAVYQGIETFKLKCAEMAANSAKTLLTATPNETIKQSSFSSVPQTLAGLGGVGSQKLQVDAALIQKAKHAGLKEK